MQFSSAYSDAFSYAFAFVLVQEGGHSDHPDDLGGETYLGLSRKAFPKLDFSTLTKEKAAAIYHRDYWRAAYCPKLPEAIALCVFDGAVQHGAVRAVTLLQDVLGLKQDGIIGPQTQRAATESNQQWLISRYILRRARLYTRILRKRPEQVAFIEGWFNRLRDLTDSAWQVSDGFVRAH
ncbi:peptidoglycan-binding protein [Agarivorans sp. B2Z047]|uniref:glycoside hydrolase family 108 protein n=1 Tax=Agarivorans sp. B2Z047 TaxID=2652721 RepID=UPI00128AEFEA|nr:glycosyl hydrolase 108 family protein [Agarivorans sp. B2Z047]MPW30476.1 peptidoglycan-binding protein [Agarivorans sp. B2Z047]UQN42304.1 peptidoglycan-binding protein [Agarivorans sp. B2Z047]